MGSKKTIKRSFTFIDLFAGVGGMRLGFEHVNGRCVYSSEKDQFARRTYHANFDDWPDGDITLKAESDIPSFEILLAGFPCQPFSSIGKREGFDHPTQGTLFYDIRRILDHHRPRGFLLENVAGLENHKGGDTIRIISDSLVELGYEFDYKVLDAVRFGVPQHRKRIYIVGKYVGDVGKYEGDEGRRVCFSWPEGSDEVVSIGPKIQTGVTGHSISRHLQDAYIFKRNDGRPQIVTHQSDFPVKTLVASYHKIQRLTGTFVKDGETGLRLLTKEECMAIMGFPDEFKIPVSRTQMYRQMGNSVAVPVIKVLARWMLDELRVLDR